MTQLIDDEQRRERRSERIYTICMVLAAIITGLGLSIGPMIGRVLAGAACQ